MNPLNVSSNPHARTDHDTLHEMMYVVLALIPATVFGVVHFGLHTLLITLASIIAACATEYIFDMITHRGNSLWDGSAVVTGLLLALVLPPTVPLFIPILGSIFAILVVKCFFGGLGQNFMNPALGARAFLLISFGSLMTNYSVDGVSSATPLAVLNGGSSVNSFKMFLGFVDGHIGISVICLLLGGIFLILTGTITWHIPVASLVSFLVLMGIFGGHGFSPAYLWTELVGGGIVLGAFFMATDPVTSPMTHEGQLLFGCFVGFLSMVFRVFSNMADGTTYAIIIANLLVPAIDMLVVPQPFGLGVKGEAAEAKKGFSFPKSAITLSLITLVAGVALAGVNALTAGKIAENQMAANLASFAEVLPDAQDFGYDDAITASIEDLDTGNYYADGAYGKVKINEAVVGSDASGQPVGYAISVSTMDGFEGEVTLTVGIANDGTAKGISFTTINETPGMGMVCDTDAWKGQFADRAVESFTLLKGGGASADNEINSVTGASTTSGAVVNAVNAALDFYRNYLG